MQLAYSAYKEDRLWTYVFKAWKVLKKNIGP